MDRCKGSLPPHPPYAHPGLGQDTHFFLLFSSEFSFLLQVFNEMIGRAPSSRFGPYALAAWLRASQFERLWIGGFTSGLGGLCC